VTRGKKVLCHDKKVAAKSTKKFENRDGTRAARANLDKNEMK